jgi:hypothetical protein
MSAAMLSYEQAVALESGRPSWVTPESIAFILLGVAVVVGVPLVRHVMRHSALVARHPHEPWIWDHSWKQELVDEQPSTLLSQLPGVVFGVFLLAFFTLLVFVGGGNEDPVVIAFLRVLFVLADGAFAWWVLIPYARQVLALLRFGRMRLCLPGIPLPLGSRSQVLLVARSSLTQLQHVSVTLRRVRERKEKRRSSKGKTRTVTVRDVEYTRTHEVDAQPLRDGKPLPIEIRPPRAGPKDSTVLSTTPRVLWELQLTSDVPGVDLDATFILPVYAVTKGPPPKP